MDELLDVICPRCGTAARLRYYGPCAPCREDLRARVAAVARSVEVTPYEPNVNVVPNDVSAPARPGPD